MTITSTSVYISQMLIDSTLWAIHSYVRKRNGTAVSDSMMAPLYWYVNTGRASLDFLRRLISAKPFMVGRILERGGSHDEVIKAISKYIGYERSDL